MKSEPDSALRTRPSLLVRIRDAGDQASWQMFVDLYGPVVYRFGRSKGLQDADAADLAQEVMATVARSINTFEYQPQRGRFRDWLWTLTRHTLARFRKERAAAVAGLPDDELDQVATALAEAAWTEEFHAQVLRTALANIRPHFEAHTWRVFELVWLDHRSATEAATEMGMPIEAVYWAKSRVLTRLEQECLELMDDLPS